MVRKTRTVVPKELRIGTAPEIRIALSGRLPIRIVGKKGRIIARLEIRRGGVKVFGAREWKAKGWSFRTLQREGISESVT